MTNVPVRPSWVASAAFGYILAVVATLAAAAVRWALDPILGNTSQFITFYLAVVVSAFVGGWRPGLLATALSSLLGPYLFVSPRYTMGVASVDARVRLIAFLCVASLIALLSGWAHAHRRKAQENARRAEESLARQAAAQETMSRLAAIVEFSDDAILSKGLDGIVQTWNPAAQRLLGYAPDEIIGKPIALLVPPERSEEEASILDRLRHGQRVEHLETVRVARDGRRIDVSVTVSPLKDEAGRIVGASKIMRDITAQKQAQDALKAAKLTAEQAKAAAEEASRAKDHFLAVLSHELRTPLTPVLTTADLLENDPQLPERYHEDVAMIRRNVELEARLIDDLLDVTRIARGKIRLDRKPIALADVIRRAVEVCTPEIEARRLHLAMDVGSCAAHPVLADAARLQQVFWNLVKNAIKFTPPGGNVSIRCWLEKDNVVAEVKDTGEGIDPRVLPHIFTPFEQGGARITHQFGGLGLGLAISKALVGLHGGTISAHSEGRGRGATFRVELPLASKASGPPSAQHSPPTTDNGQRTTDKLHILLVEDHEDTAQVMRRLLMIEGHRVEIAGDVATALEMAGTNSAFDLIISDLGLPDGSGLDLMRKLRSQGNYTPGIALSGYGQEQDIRRSQEAGFAEHLTKPTTPDRLAEAIATVTASPQFAKKVSG